jgi:acetylornithine deacetylase/succinyl-diaminopimelate desuccinylase-like protein
MRAVVDDPGVEIVPPATFRPPNQSPVDTELFRVIQSVLGRHFPGVPVTTKMLTGATECVLFRPMGIVCYGFTPLLTTAEETGTGHGDDERISESTVRSSTPIFYEVVRELAASR